MENKTTREMNITDRFLRITTNTKVMFHGHLDENTYIEIKYLGWHHKNCKIYRINTWVDECGCIFSETKKFQNIGDAIKFAVEKQINEDKYEKVGRR